MKPPKVQRFSPFQIALHWGQAAVYLTLLVSGGIILFQRLFHSEVIGQPFLAIVHRYAGIVLAAFLTLMFLAAMITGHFRTVSKDIFDCLLFRPQDLLWLIKAPINAIRPRVKMPPAGRFNAGQKLHGAFVFLAVLAAIATGVCMMVQPMALGPWMIHSAVFFAAAAFLLLHLFMSVINPFTRESLNAILTGYVSLDYVRKHHPLWLDNEPQGHHGAIVSWKALAAVLLVAGAAATILVISYGPRRMAGQVSQWANNHGADAILPGPLYVGHANVLATAKSCFACHQVRGPIPSSSCLACHPEISRVRAGQVGYHGLLKGECPQCHADHAGAMADITHLDRRAFNHQQARFGLQGKHQQVSCDRCHLRTGSSSTLRMQYLGLTFDSCMACHANPHALAGTELCTRCHTERGWGQDELVFRHDRDCAIHLEGKHQSVPCESCHSILRRGTSGATTASANAGPAQMRAIRPLPATVATTATPHGFVLGSVGSRCADCHTEPHKPTLGDNCRRCHNENGWTGRNVNSVHNRDNRYPLREAHELLRCDQCHKSVGPNAPLATARFIGTPASCTGCHQAPHRGQFEKECSDCHSEKNWKNPDISFVHSSDGVYPLRGAHESLRCGQCHKSAEPNAPLSTARFVGTPKSCVGCHQDVHRGQLLKECSTCHTQKSWKSSDLLFVHNRDSTFRIDAIHSPLSCSACHTSKEGAVLYRPLPKTCDQCHTDIAQAMAGKTPLLIGRADPHDGRVQCVQCHQPTVRSPKPEQYTQACQNCHGRKYGDLYFDWSRSLSDREERTEEFLRQLRRHNSPKAHEVAAKIRTARAVGFHNVQLARKLWDEIGSGQK